ncbi:MAG: FG-GAP repeat protein [Phycisphaerae bacterium]|nr:FG-GAP repeat protein [Phycisphaerae bacterium]
MDGVADRILNGGDPDDRFGLRMRAGGDVNGDGHNDAIIGAEYAVGACRAQSSQLSEIQETTMP